MAVTFRHTDSGRLVSCPEPEDAPVRRQQPRAHRIARFDASFDWERVEDTDDQETTRESESETSDAPKPADVRAWARAEGIDVPARGKLPDELIDRYKASRVEDHAPAQPDA